MWRRNLLITLFILAILLGTAAVVSGAGFAGMVPTAPPVPPTLASDQEMRTPAPHPTYPPSNPEGAPAIRPRVATTDPGTPAFTEEDARAYVAGHPHPDQVHAAPPATIERVEFLPSEAVDARIGATGLPAGRLLCLVTLRGSFAVSVPGGPQVTSSTGYLVFDAHTGNTLIEGFGP
jgi:hypothetical protein